MDKSFLSIEKLKEQGFCLETPPLSIIAFDPSGSGEDFAAAVEVHREEYQMGETYDPDFQVQHVFRAQRARRLPRESDFPDQISWLLALNRMQRKMQNKKQISGYVLGIETNGVGWPAYRTLVDKLGNRNIIGVTTVSGMDDKPFSGGQVKMPRLAALDNTRVLMETNRLKMRANAPGAEHLSEELAAFVWASRNRPEAVNGMHDDLVMALAIALWLGSKVIPPILKQTVAEKPHNQRIH